MTQPGRDQAGNSTDPQHFLVVIDSTFDDRITGETAGGLIGDDRTTLDLGHPGRFRIRSQCVEIGVNHDFSWSRTVLITGGGTEFDQTVGHPLRIRIEQPRFGLGGISSAFSRIADSTSDISGPGRSACRWPLIPSRVYWIESHRTRHESTILSGRRVGSAGGPIQSRIRQTQTISDHRFLGLRSSQLRNRIHLIQHNSPAPNRYRSRGRSSRPASHPNQLRGSRMAQTKPGRHPLRKIASPIRQEPLTHISIDQPVTDLGVESGQPREQMADPLIHLIIRETLPLHTPNVRTGVTETGQKPANHKENRENSKPPNDPSIPGPASRERQAIPRRHLLCRGRRIEPRPPRRGHRRARSGSWR